MKGIGILQRKTSDISVSAVIGIAAVAGLSLVFAMPKTRKMCTKVFNGVLNRIKDRMRNVNYQKNNDWENDLAEAEKLKGPIGKRKVPAVKVPSAGTIAWKEA